MINVSNTMQITLAAAMLLCATNAVAFHPEQGAAVVGSGEAAGYWQGYNTASRVPNTQIPTTFVINQSGSSVTAGYVAASGVWGDGIGTFNGSTGTISWTNSSSQCPGSYQNSYQISGNTISWTYSGWDCLGSEYGSGSANRVSIVIEGIE